MYKDFLYALVKKQAQDQGWEPKIHVGIVNKTITKDVAEGNDFLYLDHSYFNRGWSNSMFRLVRAACHQTKVYPRPDDRLKRFGTNIEPWRKTGKHILVIPSTMDQHVVFDESKSWLNGIENELRQYTSRPIVVKGNRKIGLRESLEDAWAIVSWASNAAIEAVTWGIPSFSTKWSPAWGVNSGDLRDIDNPTYPENRYEWLCSLSYASWHESEIPTIKLDDYEYSRRDDLP